MHQAVHIDNTTPGTSTASAKAAQKVRDDIRSIGYEMGVLAARYWPGLRNADRFRCMTIVDYRDAGAADSARTLNEPAHSDIFTKGYIIGFEDEAYDLAEARTEGFEDVREAGTVDGSVIVLARRLLRELVRLEVAAH